MESELPEPLDEYDGTTNIHPAYQLCNGDDDGTDSVQRRHHYRADDAEAEQYTIRSPRWPLQNEVQPTHAPQDMASQSTPPTVGSSSLDHLEPRRELAFELKVGQFRLSLLSKPTVPGSRADTGKRLLWLILAILAVGFLARSAAILWRS